MTVEVVRGREMDVEHACDAGLKIRFVIRVGGVVKEGQGDKGYRGVSGIK